MSTSFPVASDLRGWKEWWEGSLPVRALRPFPWSPSLASHLTLVLSLLACSVLPLSLGKVYGGGSTGGYLKLGCQKRSPMKRETDSERRNLFSEVSITVTTMEMMSADVIKLNDDIFSLSFWEERNSLWSQPGENSYSLDFWLTLLMF